MCGPDGWRYSLSVINADPRPVYLCTLEVRAVASSTTAGTLDRWVVRAATAGEPLMTSGKGERARPDFLNAGKAGGTYAFRKAFQDGFCRYLSDPSKWPPQPGKAAPDFDEVPLHTGRGAHVQAEAQPAHGGTDFKGFTPANPDNPPCPVCKGKMWDNREPERGGKGKFPKKSPNQPDFKCGNKACDGVWWPSKGHRPKPAGVPDDALEVDPSEVPW